MSIQWLGTVLPAIIRISISGAFTIDQVFVEMMLAPAAR